MTCERSPTPPVWPHLDDPVFSVLKSLLPWNEHSLVPNCRTEPSSEPQYFHLSCLLPCTHCYRYLGLSENIEKELLGQMRTELQVGCQVRLSPAD